MRFEKNNKLIIFAVLIILSCLYLPKFLLPIFSIIQAFGVSLLLIWLYFNQSSGLCRVLELKPLTYVGRISYGLYVYQGLFLKTGPGGELWIQQFPNNILLTIAVSVLSYHFIEKKVLKLKSRFR